MFQHAVYTNMLSTCSVHEHVANMQCTGTSVNMLSMYVHEQLVDMQCTLTCIVQEHAVEHALNMNMWSTCSLHEYVVDMQCT